MKVEVLEVCEWFHLETFSIFKLQGVFREVESFYSYEFTLPEEKGTYLLSNGDFIKYKNEICVVMYVEQHKGFKVVHLQKMRVVKEQCLKS